MRLSLHAAWEPFSQVIDEVTRSTAKLDRLSVVIRIDLLGLQVEPDDPEDLGTLGSSIGLDAVTARAMLHSLTVHPRPSF